MQGVLESRPQKRAGVAMNRSTLEWNSWASRAVLGAAPKAAPRTSWWLVPRDQFYRAAEAEQPRMAQENRTGRAVTYAPFVIE